MSLDNAPLRPPPSAGFSMRWAMIVPGLGVLILVLFIGAEFLTSNPVQPTRTSTKVTSISGTSLRAVPAVDALSVIIANGQPPGNIINAVDIPTGSVRVSHENNSQPDTGYDEQINLRSDDSQGALENFYLSDMKAQGWQIFEKGAADHNPGAIEVLGKKAGSDGFYWEMGAVVSATSFGPHTPPRGATDFTVRLFQVPDPD
jgi:hypothetical protein